MKIRIYLFGLIPFLLLTTAACSKDVVPDPDLTENINPVEDPETEDTATYMGTVEILNESLIYDGLVLVNDAGKNTPYIMDKRAKLVHEWSLQNILGNDAFLQEDGRLLVSIEADEPKISLGGQGGKLQFIAANGNVEWNFDYSSETAETHHDAELLPNGNVLAMVWEKKTADEADEAGSNAMMDVFPEALIEVDPRTNEIVWAWHSWDHLIQDFDETKSNYGNISENPQLIDVNYVSDPKGDIMHGNGIAYDSQNDLIFLSANFFSEVWVIDHSTTTLEATGHSGGNYGKGGDLVYRFGNPEAYDNPNGERLFLNNHFPNLLKGDRLGNMLIFSNGNGPNQSTVFELRLPEVFSLQANTDNEPQVVWSFTHPDLFSGKVSGAVLLPNGNRMITEGDFGIWEVTEAGEVVWKFSAPGFFWRAYHYDKNSSAIINLGL